MKPSAMPRAQAPSAHREQSGLSLVEVMVGLAIGVIVVFGLVELLANTSATYQREEAFGRLQENGRVAALVAARQIRQSRSTECKSIALHTSGSFTVKSCALLEDAGCTGDHVLTTQRAMGYDNSQDLSSPGSLSDLPGSIAANVSDRWVLGDILVTWGVDADGVAVDGAPGDDEEGKIKVARVPAGLLAGDVAMISNCRYAHIFAVSAKGGGGSSGSWVKHGVSKDDEDEDEEGDGGGDEEKINANDDLLVSKYSGYYTKGSSPYNRDAREPRSLLHLFQYRVFYVCCTKDGDLRSGSGVNGCRPGNGSYDPEQYRPALCVFDLNNGAKSGVLVPDVADLRVTYTGDSDGDGQTDFRADDHDTLRTAAWVSANDAWDAVRSASVELLLTTDADNTAMEPSKPADWMPEDWANDVGDDALGAAYDQDDKRLYQRIRFDVALRPSTPWAIWD
jgi:hypothetical protein